MAKNRRTSRRNSRANARASARAPASSASAEQRRVQLCVSEVLVDDDWNCRDALGSGADSAGAEGPGQEFSDQEFADNIAKHGCMHPPKVRQLPDGRWAVTVGFRRLRALKHNDADQVSEFIVQPSSGDERTDEFVASCENLIENLHRKNLRTFEIANKLYRMHQVAPEMTVQDLSEAVGMSRSYCSRLIRIRKRAAPELWEVFVRHDGANYGSGIGFNDLAHIVRLPKDEQLQRWQALVAERTCPHSGAADPRARKRPGAGQLRKYLRQTDTLGGSEDWQKGVRFGLLVALGRQEWFFRSSDQQRSPTSAPEPTP